MGSRDRQGAGEFGNRKSNVGHVQPGQMDRPVTEAPKKQIYFTIHRSGANSVPRVRTVVRGERESRSIVNRTTALWSIWMVSSLILAGLGFGPIFVQTRGTEVAESWGSRGASNHASWVLNRPRWTLTLTNGRKRT